MRTTFLRRISQYGALAGFLALYARTAYRGEDVLDWPVHLIFRLDPLAVLTEATAGHLPDLAWEWMGAVLMVAATLVLGRFFCGWLCPMGTLLDLVGKPLRSVFAKYRPVWRRPGPATAPALFTGLLVATFAGLPLLGFFDPLSILLRSLTLSIFPALDHVAKESFTHLLAWGVPGADATYTLLSETVLAFGRPAFLLAGLTATLFFGLLALELWAPRFWCAHLCPLGALLGILARVSPLARKKADACGRCRRCVVGCPTAAIPEIDGAEGGRGDASLCTQCGDCAEVCPQEAMKLARGPVQVVLPASPTRRLLLGSVAAGAVVAVGARVRAEARERPWDFLRPPGAVDEREFNRRCIRCGACMRVCPGGALHPALTQAGLDGLWTPRLVPRLGYCEYHCRLCGQVCPTGAIDYLEAGEKEKFFIGLAIFDKDRCLPYRGAPCIVCEEHCPTSPKAIEFDEKQALDPGGNPVTLKIPRVVESRCIGCGICETRCPLPGRSAIRVSRERPVDASPYS